MVFRNRGEADRVVPRVLLSILLKDGYNISPFVIIWDLTFLPLLSIIVESVLTTTSANSYWTLGCISFHHSFMYVQVPQVLTSLISSFSSSCGRNFAPAIPVLQSIQLLSIQVWEERFPLKTEAKKLLETSPFSSSVATSLPNFFFREYTFFYRPFLVNMLVEALLLFLPSLDKFNFSFTLAFLLYTTVLHLCTFLKLYVLVSTAYTFFSFL